MNRYRIIERERRMTKRTNKKKEKNENGRLREREREKRKDWNRRIPTRRRKTVTRVFGLVQGSGLSVFD